MFHAQDTIHYTIFYPNFILISLNTRVKLWHRTFILIILIFADYTYKFVIFLKFDFVFCFIWKKKIKKTRYVRNII